MSELTRNSQPIILIRGFGQLNVSDEKKDAYQGFNDGSVYPQKQGENYIYEGFILRFLKSNWKYQEHNDQGIPMEFKNGGWEFEILFEN